MQVHATVESLHAALRGGNDVGFVPTMGALHAGHASLIERASSENPVVVVSIFVNPLQFGAGEDFTRYPRPLTDDCAVAEAAGADHVFAPVVDEMYPNGPMLTSIHVSDITELFEGAIRPGHFDGVATVVAKLFSIVHPQRAYFGEKDWQQLEVIRRMTADLSMPVEIVPCQTVREADGLALSSRNAYLSPEERGAAAVLYGTLRQAEREIEAGKRDASDVGERMMAAMGAEPLIEPDYAVAVGSDMQVLERVEGKVRLLVAARAGKTRLLDNLGVVVS